MESVHGTLPKVAAAGAIITLGWFLVPVVVGSECGCRWCLWVVLSCDKICCIWDCWQVWGMGSDWGVDMYLCKPVACHLQRLYDGWTVASSGQDAWNAEPVSVPTNEHYGGNVFGFITRKHLSNLFQSLYTWSVLLSILYRNIKVCLERGWRHLENEGKGDWR